MDAIILASSSPRRAALLEQIGIPFVVEPSGMDEYTVPGPPVEAARQLALKKAQAVARRQASAGRIVLGADTVVVLDDQVLGKPDGRGDARAMLRALTGRAHQVITGVALVETGSGRSMVMDERTTVWMRSCAPEEIEAYLDTGEPFDKAGAYGAQGYGASLIERVEGCFYNVVGLPLARLAVALKQFNPGLPHSAFVNPQSAIRNPQS